MGKFRRAISIIFLVPVFVPVLVIAMLSGIFYIIRLRKLGDLWLHFWIRIAIYWIWLTFGARVHVTGKENVPKDDKNLCIIANHQSMIDIPLIFYSGFWCGIIGKVELRKVPVLNALMYEFNCVFINRKSLKESLKAINQGSENIKKGIPMAIFPEGTRSHDYAIGEFKAGAFKMATKARATIIPVAIQNSRRLLEDPRGFGITDVYFKILPPIETRNMDEDELRLIHEKVEKEIRSAYETLRRV